jgi:hypothetical protein
VNIRNIPFLGKYFDISVKYILGIVYGKGMKRSQVHPEVKRRILPEIEDHFFGYYDKTPWSQSGDKILYHRKPHRVNAVELVCFDLVNKKATTLGKTSTWNWQQGAMLQWLPGNLFKQECVIHNDVVSNRLVALIRNFIDGSIVKTCEYPVQSVRAD